MTSPQQAPIDILSGPCQRHCCERSEQARNAGSLRYARKDWWSEQLCPIVAARFARTDRYSMWRAVHRPRSAEWRHRSVMEPANWPAHEGRHVAIAVAEAASDLTPVQNADGQNPVEHRAPSPSAQSAQQCRAWRLRSAPREVHHEPWIGRERPRYPRRQLLQEPSLPVEGVAWCGRRDSNPHANGRGF